MNSLESDAVARHEFKERVYTLSILKNPLQVRGETRVGDLIISWEIGNYVHVAVHEPPTSYVSIFSVSYIHNVDYYTASIKQALQTLRRHMVLDDLAGA